MMQYYTPIWAVLVACSALSAVAQQPFFPTLEGDKWSYLDKTGKMVLQIDTVLYGKPRLFSEGKAAILDKKSGKFGYIDEKGKWIIKPQYTIAYDFNDGLAVVELPCDAKCLTDGNGLLFFGYTAIIDKKGKIFLNDNAQDPEPYKRFWFDNYNKNGLLRVVNGLSAGEVKTLMNRKGEMIGIRTGICCLDVRDGVVVYNTYQGNYYTDTKGKKILDLPNSGQVMSYSEGYAWLLDTTDNYILLDKKAKPVLTLSMDKYRYVHNVSEGVFSANVDDKYRYFYVNGSPLFERSFSTTDAFSNGLAHVETSDFKGYIDKKGENAITLPDFNCYDCEYDGFTKDGYALVWFFDRNSGQQLPFAMILRNGTVVFYDKKTEE